jgi:hypothetical protein
MLGAASVGGLFYFTPSDVAYRQILLQKSKIEQPQESRGRRSFDFSAAASLSNANMVNP